MTNGWRICPRVRIGGVLVVSHHMGSPNASPPPDLCPAHLRIWHAWRDHVYDPRNPLDWPGQHIGDSRTTHTERADQWAVKNLEQMEMCERVCHTGNSPQCDWPTREGE
jgi:hypothetical protein